MKRTRVMTMGFLLLGLCPAVGLARDGLVALQTADPSCPDDSGNIYVNCGNGTVTDNRTGLVWLTNADCMGAAVDWHTAMEVAAGLSDKPATSVAASNDCGLSDGSSPGEWRLPSVEEWEAMVADALGDGGDPDCTASPPTINNDSGLGCWVSGPSSFVSVQSSAYWSSSTLVGSGLNEAWGVFMGNGLIITGLKSTLSGFFVWPVRGGQ